MQHSVLKIMLLILVLLIMGCEDNATDADTDLAVDPLVEEQASIGWEINETVLAGADIMDMTKSSELIAESDMSAFSEAADMKNRMNGMIKEMQQTFVQANLQKVTGDSLIFIDPDAGRRWAYDMTRALYFDAETGRLRYVEVRFNYPEGHRLCYDSTEIVFYTEGEWYEFNESHLAELYQLQQFREGFLLQSIESRMTATEFEGNEITGVEISRDSYYNPDNRLSHINQYIKINADGSGVLQSEHNFSDGSTLMNEITFNADGTGTFSKERRNGTTITGSFDSVEDDLHGSWTEIVDFPDDLYVNRLERLAVVSIVLPDSIFNAAFREVIFFDSGKIDSSSAAMQVQEEGGVKTTTLNRTKPNGAHGTFVIVEQQDVSSLDGYWITWNGYYVSVSAEYYMDGSGYLHYEVYITEEAFLNGEEALIVADYFFSPDRSGEGTLVQDGKHYDITFDASGSAEITDGKKARMIHLY